MPPDTRLQSRNRAYDQGLRLVFSWLAVRRTPKDVARRAWKFLRESFFPLFKIYSFTVTRGIHYQPDYRVMSPQLPGLWGDRYKVRIPPGGPDTGPGDRGGSWGPRRGRDRLDHFMDWGDGHWHFVSHRSDGRIRFKGMDQYF